jgi:hypothetical protein
MSAATTKKMVSLVAEDDPNVRLDDDTVNALFALRATISKALDTFDRDCGAYIPTSKEALLAKYATTQPHDFLQIDCWERGFDCITGGGLTIQDTTELMCGPSLCRILIQHGTDRRAIADALRRAAEWVDSNTFTWCANGPTFSSESKAHTEDADGIPF